MQRYYSLLFVHIIFIFISTKVVGNKEISINIVNRKSCVYYRISHTYNIRHQSRLQCCLYCKGTLFTDFAQSGSTLYLELGLKFVSGTIAWQTVKVFLQYVLLMAIFCDMIRYTLGNYCLQTGIHIAILAERNQAYIQCLAYKEF